MFVPSVTPVSAPHTTARPAPLRWRLVIETATDATVPQARHWVHGLGASLGIDTDDAELLITELLANVAEHADGGPAWVTLAVTSGWLVLGVGDHCPHKPLERRPFDGGAEGGRGLNIAYALAARLYVDKRRAGTKRVVARLPLGVAA